jgi:hypothetical protein
MDSKGKGIDKVVHVLNEVPSQEDVLGSGDIVPRILDFDRTKLKQGSIYLTVL